MLDERDSIRLYRFSAGSDRRKPHVSEGLRRWWFAGFAVNLVACESRKNYEALRFERSSSEGILAICSP